MSYVLCHHLLRIDYLLKDESLQYHFAIGVWSSIIVSELVVFLADPFTLCLVLKPCDEISHDLQFLGAVAQHLVTHSHVRQMHFSFPFGTQMSCCTTLQFDKRDNRCRQWYPPCVYLLFVKLYMKYSFTLYHHLSTWISMLYLCKTGYDICRLIHVEGRLYYGWLFFLISHCLSTTYRKLEVAKRIFGLLVFYNLFAFDNVSGIVQ